MKFDKSRIYTSVNADKLKVGSKVIVADNIATLKEKIERNNFSTLSAILAETEQYRFRTMKSTGTGYIDFGLAYLVEEPKEIPATNREVLEWLAKSNGMVWAYQNTVTISFCISKEDIDKVCMHKVCKWEDKEWHNATREYLGI